MTDTHGLTIRQADALWDAVAVPGPDRPPYPVQHERVCRAVATLLTERPVQRVQGRCPACRGDSLFLADGGHVTCSRLECPGPTAADELLHDEQPETAPGPAATQTTEAAHCCSNCEGVSPETCLTRPKASPKETPDPAVPDTITDPEWLRQQYAAAARAVPLRLGPNAVAMARRGEPIILNMSEADDLAAAVLRVRDRHVEQLRQRLALADTVVAAEQRAEQAEDLLRVAHETSNRSETERARAVQRAEKAEEEATETAAAAALMVNLVRERADRAELQRDQLAAHLRYVLDYTGPHHNHQQPGVWDTSGKPCGHCARLDQARQHLTQLDPPKEEPASHVYLSTGCLEKPAQCKFCAAPCTCPCHKED